MQLNSMVADDKDKLFLFSMVEKYIQSGLSVRYACDKVHSDNKIGISKESFRCRFRRYASSFGRNRNNSPFSIGEEEELIGMLEGFSLLNQGLGRARFLNYVK